MNSRTKIIASFSLAMLLTGPQLLGEKIYLFHQQDAVRELVIVDSATPGTVSTVALSGFPGSDTTLFGIDFNPSNGILYGRTTDGGLNGTTVQINTTTGVMTAVGSATANGGGAFYGFDFDPTTGQYRMVSDSSNNRRFDGTTGALVQVDTSLNGAATAISNIAYSNNTSGAGTTTLYAIDHVNDNLMRIGGLNGSPSADGGLVTTIGALGVNAPNFGGFDISGTSGIAYAVFFVGGSSGLYTVNLSTGAATLLGAIGSGTEAYSGLAVDTPAPSPSGVPEPSSLAMIGIGALGLILARRR